MIWWDTGAVHKAAPVPIVLLHFLLGPTPVRLTHPTLCTQIDELIREADKDGDGQIGAKHDIPSARFPITLQMLSPPVLVAICTAYFPTIAMLSTTQPCIAWLCLAFAGVCADI